MDYEIRRQPCPKVEPGEFVFAATALEHPHIHGMTAGLLEAGASLKWVWDKDPRKVDAFLASFPQAMPARCLEEILQDTQVAMVAAADVPNERAGLGITVMNAGKHYFTDKTPLTSLPQLEAVTECCAVTSRRYFCYYSERLHSEAGGFVGQLVREGVIGRVVQVLGMGPHRLNPLSRPDWFFDKERYGGILCDIGSHQIEQFLYYTGAKDARVTHARVENFAHPEYPGLEDFGEASLTADNGASDYMRVDWLTPDGLSAWGDGRTFLLGTDGYIETRKYVNIAADRGGGHVFLVDGKGEYHFDVSGKVGCPFFGEMIRDCLDGTERAMTQSHILKTAELCIKAQLLADIG
ncbi:MAG: Gfo/Idh/MocA family protein [Eubacteriales bacterium]